MEAAADTAGDVGQDVECIAEYAVSVEQDAVDGAAVVDAVAVDAAEVGAAAADAVANDAAVDGAAAVALKDPFSQGWSQSEKRCTSISACLPG